MQSARLRITGRAVQTSILIVAVLATGMIAFTQSRPSANVLGDKVKAKAMPFRLEQVQLLDSAFKKAMELDAAFLLELEPQSSAQAQG